MDILSAIIKFSDNINEFLGKAFSLLCIGIIFLTFFTVFERYFFQTTENWQSELIRFMHAMMFMSVVGYTLKHSAHVSVDVFYEKFSEKTKAWVKLIGALFCIIPFCLVIIYYGWNYVSESWLILEGSREDHGMPGVFILKSFILVFGLSLFLQSLSLICSSIKDINNG